MLKACEFGVENDFLTLNEIWKGQELIQDRAEGMHAQGKADNSPINLMP